MHYLTRVALEEALCYDECIWKPNLQDIDETSSMANGIASRNFA